jgi:hypothetical protein
MSELVHYARSLPDQLVYIDVEPCLDAVPWRVHECVARVTPKGRERKPSLRRGYPLNTHGLLQLCLFGCKPFLGLIERQVRDVPTKKRRVPPKRQIYPCPQRPRLFEAIASALLEHEEWCRDLDIWPAVAERQDQTVASMPKLVTTSWLLAIFGDSG